MHYKKFAFHLQELPKESQLKELKLYLQKMKDTDLREEAESFFINFYGKVDDRAPVVLMLFHGIRTRAEWQGRLVHLMKEESDIEVVPCKYGVVGTFTLIVPWLRKRPASLVKRHFEDMRKQYPKHKLVVVAHSFGTYLVAKELKENNEHIDRVLLCGSVLPQAFDWGQAWSRAKRSNVVNEVGAKDLWPVMAHITAPGCGASGFLGFGNPCVTDREHSVGHSEFFDDEHMRKYWVPFLVEGRIVPSKLSPESGKLKSFLSFLCSLPNAVVWYVAIIFLVAVYLS